MWNRSKPWNRKWGGFRRKKSAPKRLSVRALPRSVARKRSDWVWLYNDSGSFDVGTSQGCGIRCIEFGGSYCEEPSTRIPIMPEGAVAALYDDDVTIAAMRGFINMKPRWTTPSGCDSAAWILRMQGEQWPIYLKAGLYKQELTTVQGGIPPFVNPNVGDDWTDVSALKRWNHIWQPRGRQSITYRQADDFIGVCSDTVRDAYTVPPAASGTQATYNVPAISTGCDPMTVNDIVEGCVVSHLNFERENHAWYRMSLNRRTPIRLHENDSLDIFMNWSIPRPFDECVPLCGVNTDGTNPCAMQMSIQLAVKLEFG